MHYAKIMKDCILLLGLLILPAFLAAQEGFWSFDQTSQLQAQLSNSGLSYPIPKSGTDKSGEIKQAVLRFFNGNACFINEKGLALGITTTQIIPDSILERLDSGIWIAPTDQGVPLSNIRLEIYLDSKPATTLASLGDISFQPPFIYEVHLSGPEQTQLVERKYLSLKGAQLLGVFKLPVESAVNPQIGILMRVNMGANSIERLGDSPKNAFLPRASSLDSITGHLILGFPHSSSIHRTSLELQYAQELSRCNQDLDRALGAYLTRKPFITEEGVFRNYENLQLLDQVLPQRAIQEAEFRHQLSSNPALKSKYGPILDSCRAAFKDLQRYIPAYVYTKGVIYSPCSFFEAVRLFTMWRGKIGSSAHRLPNLEESQYFPEVFKRLPPTENELLLPELFQRYFTQLPAEHLAPYAKQLAIYAQKDYAQLSENLLLKSKFSQPEEICRILEEDFLGNIDQLAIDPAVQFVDSVLQFYAQKVVPAMEKARRKAFQKNRELSTAMRQVLPNYPAYPEADHSLRLSFGTQLKPAEDNKALLLSNAHLLETHLGSPVLNPRGELIGLVIGPDQNSQFNAYFYDPLRSRSLIWNINAIREQLAKHPSGRFMLDEWP